MTLEALGREYLRQAEILKKSIDELKAEIQKENRKCIHDIVKQNRLYQMQECYSDLCINGHAMINYYKR